MSSDDPLTEATWRLRSQTTAVHETASLGASLAADELPRWSSDHRALAGILTDELTSLATTLRSVERASASIDELHRDATEHRTRLQRHLDRAGTDLAVSRERLLQAAVVDEQAEDLHDRLSRRISTIRHLLE